jgi:hypothetical protein
VVLDGGTSAGGPDGDFNFQTISQGFVNSGTGATRHTHQGAYVEPLETATDAATVTLNLALGEAHTVTIAASRVLDFANPLAGDRGWLRVIHGAAATTFTSYTVSGGTVKFPGGVAPVLSVGGGDVDILEWFTDGTDIFLNLVGAAYA